MSVLRFKDPATNEWKEITTIMGPAGPQGPKGEDGGIKFEELTDAQKEELRGPQGVPGPQGPEGEQGPIGPAGQDYVLTEEDKQEIAGMVEIPSEDVDLSDYYTKSEVDGLIPNIPIKAGEGDGAIKSEEATKAGGANSIVLGVSSSSSGHRNIILGGYNTTGFGASAVAIGESNQSGYQASIAIGNKLETSKAYQMVIGRNNINDNTATFIIGNGTGINTRTARNAMTVNEDNQVHFPGTVVIGENKIEIATKDDIPTEAQINTLITTALGNIGVAEEGAY